MAALYLTSGYLANHNPEWLPLATAFTDKPSALPFALFVHFNGWFWQFLGHFKFEGRAPALFDNLTQGEYEMRGRRPSHRRSSHCQLVSWSGWPHGPPQK